MNTAANRHDSVLAVRLTALETRIDTILPTLATKADIGEVKADIGEVKADIGEVKASIGEVKASIGEIKAALGAAIGDAKAAIAETKSAIITWMTASLFALTAIFLSSLFFVANRLAPVVGAIQTAAVPTPPPAALLLPASPQTPVGK